MRDPPNDYDLMPAHERDRAAVLAMARKHGWRMPRWAPEQKRKPTRSGWLGRVLRIFLG